VDPQQAVSPGPGRACREAPEKEECADNSFLSRLPPHAGQTGAWAAAVIRISEV
jgi:hypothetical protein